MSNDWVKEAARPALASLVDPNAPNVARTWNYMVGGRDNFEVDRRAARQLFAASPVLQDAPLACRAFLRRVVSYLVAEAGIRQFLDIGTGLPLAGSTHEVAQALDPQCRVVYVDNDPVVLSHARAVLRPEPGRVASYLDADARDPEAIIAAAGATLDFTRPVGIVMINILNFIPGPAEVAAVLAALRGAVARGSHLAIAHPLANSGLEPAARRWNAIGGTPVWLRDRAEVASWLDGLELADPGLVDIDTWRPAPGDPVCRNGMPMAGVVARRT